MKTQRFIGLLCLCWSWALPGRGQHPNFVHLTPTQIEADTMQRLGRGAAWRYQPGQPSNWASPALDDHAWPLVSASFLFKQGPPGWRGTGCFRIRLTLDSALLGRPLGLRIAQEGASEVYLDGKLLGRYGTVGTSGATTRGIRPRYLMLPFMLHDTGPHLLAVRYAKFNFWPPPYGGVALWVAPAERLLADRVSLARSDTFNLMHVTSAGVLALLHFFLFLFYRSQRTNLYFSVYMAVMAGATLMIFWRATFMEEQARWWAQLGFQVCSALATVLLLRFIYAVCGIRLPRLWLGLLVLTGVVHVSCWLAAPWADNSLPQVVGWVYVAAGFDALRVLGWALWRRQPGIGLLLAGTVGTLMITYVANTLLSKPWYSHDPVIGQLSIQLCGMMMPVCMSIYLARDFATTQRNLEVQLRQVQELSKQARRQEAERQQLISAQNEQLESTVQVRTEEIRQQNTVLAQQKAEITEQAEKLQELDKAKSRFFTNITHEFRTPLTLMLGPAELIAATSQEPATRQHAGLVQRNAHHLLRLINQLLDLSKLEAGHLALAPVSDDLVRFVRGLCGAFESLAQQRGITTSFLASHPALYLDFDPDKLEKIVYNLLSNAFKFTPDGGQVTVQLRQLEPAAPATEAWVQLTVRDTGRGIAPEQLPHLFDRFYQADSSATREQEGTGIGLALTKELVELHGGTVALVSAPGQGTTVTVQLPVRHVAAPALPPSLPTSIEPAETAPTIASETPAVEATQVLVIEDNADVRAFIRATLAPHYHVLEAVNGEEGVTLARELVPDLVLTDVMMPRLDGHGVCRALRHDERTSHIPIIMLTAKAGLESKLEGLETGADAYLPKPFSTPELLATIENLLRGRQLLREAYRRGFAATAGVGLPSMEQAFVARVQQVVEQYLDDEGFSVEVLSREVGLSRTQLHRKLKALLNQAPGDFIRVVRLERAQELLAGNVGTVSEVAYQVGFSSPANFSTSFSRHFGYAPSEARKRTIPSV